MNNNKKSRKKTIIGLIIGLLALALILARFAMPQKTNYTEVKPTIGNMTTYYSFSGSVEAKSSQTVYAGQAMQVKEVKTAVGDQVTKDTVLMTTTTGQEIKPDISGEIVNMYADENAQMMPGAKLADVIDLSNLQLTVQVDENDLSAVSVGKDALVTINALNKDVNGKITDVSKEGTFQNGYSTFSATISLPQESNLRVGMSAQAKIKNQSASSVVILPMSAIQFDANNNPYVLLKDSGNIPKQVGITVGINDGINVQIKSGVKASDIVLVPPAIAAAKSSGFDQGSQIKQDKSSNQQGGSGGAVNNE